MVPFVVQKCCWHSALFGDHIQCLGPNWICWLFTFLVT